MYSLVFVYNADSGFFNSLTDYLHKQFSPGTYNCRLCALTHSHKMHADWQKFVTGLNHPVVFLHRDELTAQYGRDGDALPAVFAETEGKLSLLIAADEIYRCQGLDELMALVCRSLPD